MARVLQSKLLHAKGHNETKLMQLLNNMMESDSQGVSSEEAALTETKPVEEPGVYTDKKKFLKAIHGRFLDLVQPSQSGLMDRLRSVGAIDGDDEEEVLAEKTTRDKNRKLLKILDRVPPKLWGQKWMPILKNLYSHVLEGAEFRWDEQSDLASRCLRHAIMERVPIKKFADFLQSTPSCPRNLYWSLVESRASGESKWKQCFDLMRENSKDTLMRRMKQFLLENGVDCMFSLTTLRRQFRTGCLCACRAQLQARPKKRQLAKIRDENSSDSPYPQSSDSGEAVNSVSDSSSRNSTEMLNVGSWQVTAADLPSVTSKSIQGQETVKSIMEALADVAYIQAHERKLESLISHLLVNPINRGRPSHTSGANLTDLSEIKKLHDEIIILYEKVEITLRKAKPKTACLLSSVSYKLNQLEREFEEVRGIVGRSRKLLRKLQSINRHAVFRDSKSLLAYGARVSKACEKFQRAKEPDCLVESKQNKKCVGRRHVNPKVSLPEHGDSSKLSFQVVSQFPSCTSISGLSERGESFIYITMGCFDMFTFVLAVILCIVNMIFAILIAIPLWCTLYRSKSAHSRPT